MQSNCFGTALATTLVACASVACSPAPDGDAIVTRPLEATSEPLTVGNTVRPGVRVPAGVPHEIPLLPMAAGRLELAVAPLDARGGSAEVRLHSDANPDLDRVLCALEFAADPVAAWHECSTEVFVASEDLRLVVTAEAPGGGNFAVSVPTHTGFSTAAAFPNVFVIVLDAARADAFRSYNSASPQGEHLAALARDGITFAQSRSSSPWTRPAVASLMTGLPPWRHGVLDRRDLLASGFETLAETFANAGYATYAYITNPNLLSAFGFQQGFDVFEDLGSVAWKSEKVDAAPVFARVLESFDPARARPEFHYIHLMDPHGPYVPPPAELRHTRNLLSPLRFSPPHMAYRAEILDVDRKLGAFVHDVRSAGAYDDALIVVVADHGEAFNEHGVSGHGFQMYDESIRIPAILKLPGNRHAGSISQVALGLEEIHGIVLDSSVRSDVEQGIPAWLSSEPSGTQIAVLTLEQARQSAITENGWKLIVDHVSGEEQLFDLERDPRERWDRSTERPDLRIAMRQTLDAERIHDSSALHLRWCGTELRSRVDMTVEARNLELRGVRLESTDTIAKPDGRKRRVTFDLPPRTNPLADALTAVGDVAAVKNQRATFPDQDGLVIPLSSRGGGRENALRLHIVAPGAWDIGLGASSELSPGRSPIDLTSALPDLLVAPSDPIGCPARPPERPLLRVWYIADPDKIDADALSPETIERLRALGYQW